MQNAKCPFYSRKKTWEDATSHSFFFFSFSFFRNSFSHRAFSIYFHLPTLPSVGIRGRKNGFFPILNFFPFFFFLIFLFFPQHTTSMASTVCMSITYLIITFSIFMWCRSKTSLFLLGETFPGPFFSSFSKRRGRARSSKVLNQHVYQSCVVMYSTSCRVDQRTNGSRRADGAILLIGTLMLLLHLLPYALSYRGFPGICMHDVREPNQPR